MRSNKHQREQKFSIYGSGFSIPPLELEKKKINSMRDRSYEGTLDIPLQLTGSLGHIYELLCACDVDAHLVFLREHPETSEIKISDSAQKLKVSDMIGGIITRTGLARDEADSSDFYDATDDFFRQLKGGNN